MAIVKVYCRLCRRLNDDDDDDDEIIWMMFPDECRKDTTASFTGAKTERKWLMKPKFINKTDE